MHLLDGLLKANLRGAPKPLVHGPLDPSLDKKQAELERDRRHAQAAAAERAQEGRTLQHHLFGGIPLTAQPSPQPHPQPQPWPQALALAHPSPTPTPTLALALALAPSRHAAQGDQLLGLRPPDRAARAAAGPRARRDQVWRGAAARAAARHERVVPWRRLAREWLRRGRPGGRPGLRRGPPSALLACPCTHPWQRLGSALAASDSPITRLTRAHTPWHPVTRT